MNENGRFNFGERANIAKNYRLPPKLPAIQCNYFVMYNKFYTVWAEMRKINVQIYSGINE